MRDSIEEICGKVLEGKGIKKEEVLRLSRAGGGDIFSLLEAANRIREKFRGDEVDLCAVVNAKAGNCSEDCIFCSQSAHHRANIERFPLVSAEEMLEAAKRAERMEAAEFGLVTSGRGINDREAAVIGEGLRLIGEKLSLRRCASLGALSEERARLLKESGLQRYHHNLESAESFFPQLCTTHSFRERLETVKVAKGAGLEVCSGGIFGLGETPEQRIELAFTLKELNVDSIPLNFLHPIPDTPCEEKLPPTPLDILKTIALFRFVLPGKDIKVCGGRERNLRSLQPLLFLAGANGMLIGNYLTTSGQTPEADLQMIKDLGLRVRPRKVL
jgi:biotin synthase